MLKILENKFMAAAKIGLDLIYKADILSSLIKDFRVSHS